MANTLIELLKKHLNPRTLESLNPLHKLHQQIRKRTINCQ